MFPIPTHFELWHHSSMSYSYITWAMATSGGQWLHQVGNGYIRWAMATSGGQWLHHVGNGYIRWAMATSGGLCLHQLGDGCISWATATSAGLQLHQLSYSYISWATAASGRLQLHQLRKRSQYAIISYFTLMNGGKSAAWMKRGLGNPGLCYSTHACHLQPTQPGNPSVASTWPPVQDYMKFAPFSNGPVPARRWGAS